MKFILVIGVALLAVAVEAATVSHLFMEEWHTFKKQHGKTYENINEEKYRMQVYLNNSRIIEEHNKRYAEGEVSFEMGMNQFGDLHAHEFKRMMLMDLHATEEQLKRSTACEEQPAYNTSTMTLSDSWNWVDKGAVTPVRFQGQCEACWAFSAVGALEGHHFIKFGNQVNLSEQNLMDCSGAYGNQKCNGKGGFPEWALLYVIDNGGIDTRESYPYIFGDNEKCNYNASNSVEKITGCRILPPNDEEQLKIAVEKEGPVAVGMVATDCFQFYKSGIYYTNQCDHQNLNHAVLIVGFGSEHGHDYWLVKNSWDTIWGEKGYFRIARNMGNHCGIATRSVFPVTDKTDE